MKELSLVSHCFRQSFCVDWANSKIREPLAKKIIQLFLARLWLFVCLSVLLCLFCLFVVLLFCCFVLFCFVCLFRQESGKTGWDFLLSHETKTQISSWKEKKALPASFHNNKKGCFFRRVSKSVSKGVSKSVCEQKKCKSALSWLMLATLLSAFRLTFPQESESLARTVSSNAQFVSQQEFAKRVRREPTKRSLSTE